MIQLPSNWMDLLMVSEQSKAVYLHLVNDNGQYFTYYYRLDPAFPVTRLLEDLTTAINAAAPTEQAYSLQPDLSTPKAEPLDQNWKPAPLPGLDIVSFKQYEVMKQAPGQVESSPPPPPANAAGPQEV